MSGWPFRKKATFPTYSLLEKVPTRGVPEELRLREEGDDFNAYADNIRGGVVWARF